MHRFECKYLLVEEKMQLYVNIEWADFWPLIVPIPRREARLHQLEKVGEIGKLKLLCVWD